MACCHHPEGLQVTTSGNRVYLIRYNLMTTTRSMRRQLTMLCAHSVLRCWFPSSQGNRCPQRSCRRWWRGCLLPWSNLRRGFCRTRLLSSGARFLWQILWPLWSWCKWVLGYGNERKTCCWAGRDAAYGNTWLGGRAYLSTTKTTGRRQQWVQKISCFFKRRNWLQQICFCSSQNVFLFHPDFVFDL